MDARAIPVDTDRVIVTINSSFVSSFGACRGRLRLKASWPAGVILNCDAIVFVGSVGSGTARYNSRFSCG